jgi:hypothetical protein
MLRVNGHFKTRHSSGWATAAVAEQCLSTPGAGSLPCGWTTGVRQSYASVHTEDTAVPTVKFRLCMLY